MKKSARPKTAAPESARSAKNLPRQRKASLNSKELLSEPDILSLREINISPKSTISRNSNAELVSADDERISTRALGEPREDDAKEESRIAKKNERTSKDRDGRDHAEQSGVEHTRQRKTSVGKPTSPQRQRKVSVGNYNVGPARERKMSIGDEKHQRQRKMSTGIIKDAHPTTSATPSTQEEPTQARHQRKPQAGTSLTPSLDVSTKYSRSDNRRSSIDTRVNEPRLTVISDVSSTRQGKVSLVSQGSPSSTPSVDKQPTADVADDRENRVQYTTGRAFADGRPVSTKAERHTPKSALKRVAFVEATQEVSNTHEYDDPHHLVDEKTLKVIAKYHLSPDSVQECLEAFGLIDSEHIGSIVRLQLYRVLRKLGHELAEDEVNRMILDMDSSGDGSIDFSEFLLALHRHKEKHKQEKEEYEQQLMDAFQFFDQHHNGYLDKNDIKNMMTTLSGNEPIDDSEVDQMIVEADMNGDGRIQYEEFVNIMKMLEN